MPIINLANLKSLSFRKTNEPIESTPVSRNIGKLPWVPAFIVPTILLFPIFVWVMLDNSPFGGDQSQYGTQSVNLFHALVVSPLSWAKLIFASGAFKAPGIAWLGQFFVPLGYGIGSVDKGLLLSIIATQFISLLLLFLLIWEITDHDMLGAFLGCLIFASAPLFIHMSHQYMVEPLQTLSTTWFLLIMVFSPRWGKALTISQLLGATMVAMLAKVSSPLYCFVPGLVALGFTLFPNQPYKLWNWQDRRTLLTLALVIPISFATIIWYLRNSYAVFMHLVNASTGKVAAIWGKEDTFLNTLIYWLESIRRVFFLSDISLFLVLAIIIVGSYIFIQAGSARSNFRLFSTSIILQVAIVLAVFAQSSNRSVRYLLPLLPYIPLLTCLILSRIHKPVLTGLLVSIFLVQYSYFHARNLGILDVTPQTAAHTLRIEYSDQSKQTLQSIVDHTCNKTDTGIINVLAIDPLIKGDWLAPEPANYVVAKSLMTGLQPPPCHYAYIGNSFFGSSVQDAWDRIVSMNVRYVVITDPKIYSPPVNAINQVLDPENIYVILDYLENSGYFHMLFQLPEDPGILIFKRIKK